MELNTFLNSGFKVAAKGTTAIDANQQLTIRINSVDYNGDNAFVIASVANGLRSTWHDYPRNSPGAFSPYSASIHLTSNTTLSVIGGVASGAHNHGLASVQWIVLDKKS